MKKLLGMAGRAGIEAAAVGIPSAMIALNAYHQARYMGVGWQTVVAILACAALPFRHRFPRWVMLLCLPAMAGGNGWPPTVVALFSLGRANPRWPILGTWIVLTGLAGVGPLVWSQDLHPAQWLITGVFVLLGLWAPTAVGALVTTRAELAESLTKLRQATEAEAAAEAETARAEERASIAREMHDAVGHHTTLIAVEAAGLAATSEDEEIQRAATRLRSLAVSALGEMRTTLGLMSSELSSSTVDSLPGLVERVAESGMDVVLRDQLGSRSDIPAATGRAAYRIVQEALTNASKHAPGAAVEVTLSRDDTHLVITVSNGQRTRSVDAEVFGHSGHPGHSGGGRGLVGLAERARLAGGEFRSGARDDGGFEVRATLPAA